MNKIYLDHAAATPMDSLVLEAMKPYFSELFYNPSSPYAPAVQVKRDYREAKARIARELGVMGDELVMTAGATESVNLGLSAVGSGKIAVGAIEHASVLETAKYLKGIIIPVDSKGYVTAEAVRRVITSDIVLISVGLVNNELGIIQPIDEIMKVVIEERERRYASGETSPLYVHCDASQGLSLLDIKPKRMGIDLLTLSAAKIYGPKQVGLLWVRPGVKVLPRIAGGGQEGGLRSGTENVAGVVGFATAIELVARRRSNEIKRIRKLRDEMQQTLERELPDIIISSDKKRGLVNFLHISFPGIDAERLIFLLEARGVMVATGSACAANKGTQSHVLTAIGMSDEAIRGSLRISLGRLSTEEDCRKATRMIIEAVRIERERLQ